CIPQKKRMTSFEYYDSITDTEIVHALQQLEQSIRLFQPWVASFHERMKHVWTTYFEWWFYKYQKQTIGLWCKHIFEHEKTGPCELYELHLGPWFTIAIRGRPNTESNCCATLTVTTDNDLD